MSAPKGPFDATAVRAEYRPHLDQLHVWFGGAPVPSVGVLLAEGRGEVVARVDPERGEVVGLEVGHFLAEFVPGDGRRP